jgi:predicted metal-binding membrane protein
MGMQLGVFLVFWTVMIVAMMGPSVAPIAALQQEALRQRMPWPSLIADVGAFLLGYLVVWTAFGLPIFGLAALEGYLVTSAPPAAIAAGALVVAGCYQLTPLQARCLAACNPHVCAQTRVPNPGPRIGCCRRRWALGWRTAVIAWGPVAGACWHWRRWVA